MREDDKYDAAILIIPEVASMFFRFTLEDGTTIKNFTERLGILIKCIIDHAGTPLASKAEKILNTYCELFRHDSSNQHIKEKMELAREAMKTIKTEAVTSRASIVNLHLNFLLLDALTDCDSGINEILASDDEFLNKIKFVLSRILSILERIDVTLDLPEKKIFNRFTNYIACIVRKIADVDCESNRKVQLYKNFLPILEAILSPKLSTPLKDQSAWRNTLLAYLRLHLAKRSVPFLSCEDEEAAARLTRMKKPDSHERPLPAPQRPSKRVRFAA